MKKKSKTDAVYNFSKNTDFFEFLIAAFVSVIAGIVLLYRALAGGNTKVQNIVIIFVAIVVLVYLVISINTKRKRLRTKKYKKV